jgi:hypothetical protein
MSTELLRIRALRLTIVVLDWMCYEDGAARLPQNPVYGRTEQSLYPKAEAMGTH